MLLSSGRLHSPLAQISPRSKETIFLSTWLLTTQMRLAWGWLTGRLTAKMQELEAGSNVLCSHSLGRPLVSQVTFSSSVAPEALHSRVTLHQSGVMNNDSIRIWGRGTVSGVRSNKRIEHYICGKHYMSQFSIYYLIETQTYKGAYKRSGYILYINTIFLKINIHQGIIKKGATKINCK